MGKKYYVAIKREVSTLPRHSACWIDAMAQLDTGCKSLTDEKQFRMALSLTNCFLKKTGREIYPCPYQVDVADCTGNMTSEAYNTYAEFFGNTKNICFFLQAQIWHEETDKTIVRLANNSNEVAKHLEQSKILQKDILLKQQEAIRKQLDAIENQARLMRSGNILERTIKESRSDVHQIMKEFKHSTNEHRDMIIAVFDRY